MAEATRTRSGSVLVAAGIFVSRVAGLVREIAIAAFLGAGTATEAVRAAMRIPNLLQNLFGEGVLSASFIPVYAGLLEDGEHERAQRLAGAVLGLLAAVTTVLVVLGVLLARPFTWLLTAGQLPDEVFEATVPLVRIVTIGLGFLVISAWCLGVLNTHGRFFVSYAAPVAWNAVQIAVLVVVGLAGWAKLDIATALAWGVVVGGIAQVLVQVPALREVASDVRPSLDRHTAEVRDVGRRFVPVLIGRGVIQLSAYVDLLLAAILAQGALTVLGYAQVLYLLPIGLFAMSVAAAELPAMSRLTDDLVALAERARRGFAQIGFFMCFTAVAYLTAGDLIVATLYQSIAGSIFGGTEFVDELVISTWLVLAALALGLPAIGLSRLSQNTMFALGNTRGPAEIAVFRVLVSAVVGLVLAFQFDQVIVEGMTLIMPGDGFELSGPLSREERSVEDIFRLGAVGLALGSALAAWVELVLLERLIAKSLPRPPSAFHALRRLARPSALSFLAAAVLKTLTDGWPSPIALLLTVGLAGGVYVVTCFRLGIGEADLILRPVRRFIWHR
ncbi:MAG: murein biosynthesis integral membrane protein MurJ [Acidimicrobiia bacterium]|nr:murein biosynthesis integral membrane protein MurJ [Acidimicrobiia bacterium]